MLGRCHAALGQHELSAAAFDASIELTRTGRLLMSEALAVRGRALAGRGAGGTGGHWSEGNGRDRLVEVLARMQLGEADRLALLGQAD